jgi:type IV secretion system protein VirB10
VDGQTSGELDKSEGTVRSEGNKGGDARTVGETAGAGASVGVIAARSAMGAGIGAAAGAAAGLIGVLATRGPDAVLARGSTVEMVLDRPVSFDESDLNFGGYQPPRSAASSTPAASPAPAARKRWPW